MTDILSLLRNLNRPRLLVETARLGLPHYQRQRHLGRIFEDPDLPGPRQAAVHLISLEQLHEAARASGSADYSPTRHVEILIALMAEARDVLAIANDLSSPRPVTLQAV